MAFEPESIPEQPQVDAALSYEAARRRALDEFERRFVVDLLRLHGGRVVRAAAAAGMDRRYLHRLMRRHGIKRS